MKRIFLLTIYLLHFLPLLTNGQGKATHPASEKGIVKIIFSNLVNGNKAVLNDSLYHNPLEENFTLSKLKYYISHPSLHHQAINTFKDEGDYLVDQNIDSSLVITFPVPADNYDSISFLIGVDSIKNTSGAQTGALDPLNDMFWTWNSGYIMFKIEANSPQSNVVNNKIEYHIGGFSGVNSVLKYITLPFPSGKVLKVAKGKISEIWIDADLDKFWQGDVALKIQQTPVCSVTGSLAKQIAGNFSNIFSVTGIINND